jgi:hypothetical protein
MAESESPQFSQLIDWLEGRLSEEEARAVAEQLGNASEATQADLAWLRTFHQASQTIKLASPPPEVRDILKRRFADYAETRRGPGFFRQLLANLTFDSRTQLATAGLRSAATEGQQRQLIYSTEMAEIALNIQPHPHEQSLDLTGQVFLVAEVAQNALSVQLLLDATPIRLATTDELGEFAFEAVPAGEYKIVVSAGQFEVLIPSVPVQA